MKIPLDTIIHIHKAKFPKYEEAPYISTGDEIVAVWKTKVIWKSILYPTGTTATKLGNNAKMKVKVQTTSHMVSKKVFIHTLSQATCKPSNRHKCVSWA